MKTQQHNNVLSGLAAVCVAASLVSAQSERTKQEPATEQFRTIASQAYGLSADADGRPLAIAPTYEARFDAQGMRFDPALGAKERAQSLSLRSVSAGREQGAPTAFEPASPSADELRVAYRRAPGISERFDVGAEGIELSYEFEYPLVGQGDLVVRTRLDTELTAEPGLYPRGLKFLTARGAGISIGGVTGIDASGDRVEGSMRWDGAYLELVLPAEFVDGARYPLTLDPLIGSEILGDPGTFDSTQSDVAYDVSTARYLVVFSRRFGIDDARIRAQHFTSGGNLSGTVFSVSQATGLLASHPVIANNNPFNRFVVAWQQSASTFGPADIMACAVDANTTTRSPVLAITSTSSNEISPDLSGEREPTVSSSRDEVIVVWNSQTNGIRATTIDIDPLASINAAAPVTVTSDSTARNPAASKSGGAPGRHAFVWQEGSNDVRAALYSRSLAPIGTPVLVDSNGFNPDVDGDGVNFMFAFDRSENGQNGLAPRDVFCRTFRWGGAAFVAVDSSTVVENDSNDDETAPAVGFLGPKFVIAWSDQDPALFDYRGRLRAFAPNGCVWCGDAEAFGVGAHRVNGIQIGPRWAAGSSSDQAVICWAEADITPPFESEVVIQRFEALTGSGGAIANVAAGCGGGGVASVGGTFQFGRTVDIDLAGADPLAPTGVLHIGSAASPIAPCGPCSILSPFVAVPTMIVNGNTSVSLTLGCSPDLVGVSLRFQFANAITATAPCLNLPVGLSNIIDATLAY